MKSDRTVNGEVLAVAVMTARIQQWDNFITWSTNRANHVVSCSKENCHHQLLKLSELFILIHKTSFLSGQPGPLIHPRFHISAMAPGLMRRREIDLPSQLLFKYTDTNTGGTVKKSTTEFTSSQNHSLSLAAINWGRENKKRERKKWEAWCWHSNYTLAKGYVLVSPGGLEEDVLFVSYPYPPHAVFVLEFRYTAFSKEWLHAMLALQKE